MNINSASNSMNFINRMIGLSQQRQANQIAKLSSGFRINTGKDSPADLIISEQLRAQSHGAERAIRNTQEINNALSIAEGGLGGMADMLTRMKGLAVHALNSGVTTPGQVNADQAELNSLLNSIQRIANTTNYAGRNLLNGSQDFSPTVNDPKELLTANSFAFERVDGLSSGDVSIRFEGGAANQAEKAWIASARTGPTATEGQEFTITGNLGSRAYSFSAGATLEEMAAQINQNTGSTGVQAELVRLDPNDPESPAQQLRLVSTEYGSQYYAQVDQRSGTLFGTGRVSDVGQDAVVSINGVQVKANGLNVQYDDGLTRGSFTLSEAAAQTGYDQSTPADASAPAQAGVRLASGGAQFQLGEGAGGQNRESLGLPSFDLVNLGRVTVDGRTYSMLDLYGGGPASLSSNPEIAMKVIDQAISDVAGGRGRIGAYQANTLQTNLNNLQVELQNITATESNIRDADMAQSITEMLLDRLREQAGLKMYQASKVSAQNTAKLLLGQG